MLHILGFVIHGEAKGNGTVKGCIAVHKGKGFYLAPRDEAFYEKNACEVMLGTRAERIDAEKNQVRLAGGGVIAYEKLLVATGSVPFVPPVKGRETAKNTFTFTTMDDAAGVGEILDKNSKVVILGAGLIGLKAAEAVAGQCAGVTVVDLADRGFSIASLIVLAHGEKQILHLILIELI